MANCEKTGIVERVEKAVADGDAAAMERIVNRERWGMGDEAPATPKPAVAKPIYNYPRVPY